MHTSTRSVSCRALACCLACICTLLAASAVGAHAEYRSSVPANGGTVAAAPTQVVITFSKETSATRSNGAVLDAAGTVVSTGWTVDLNERTKMSIALKPNLSSGIYTVKYTSLSEDDGHVVDGSFIYTVDPNASAVGSTATSTGGKGAPWGIWLILFTLSLAVIVGGLFLIRARMAGALAAVTQPAPPRDETA